jgi:hypothetical protein
MQFESGVFGDPTFSKLPGGVKAEICFPSSASLCPLCGGFALQS